MAVTNQPYIAPELYSGTFSAGTFDIHPASGLNHNPYNTTVGTPVPYMYPIAYTTESIGSSENETVYVSIQYYIPDINNTDINRGAMYYQLNGGTPIANAIIKLQQDPVTASGYPLSATPYSISCIGAPYQTTHSSGTYMCSNNESLLLALVNTNPALTQSFKLTDTNVVSMISAPLYPGQSNIARTTITSTVGDIWAVLVYRADLVWAQSYKAIMFRDFKVQRYKSVTQISDKGVLIFNNPDQYVKFSSESNGDGGATQHSIISVDTLKAHTIYADNIISDNTTTKGGDSPTGGGGIQGLQYDGNRTIISDYTISAPAFSGEGFTLPNDYVPTRDMGYFPAGTSLLKGKNLLQAIEDAFKFAAPAVTNTTPTYATSGSTTLFIKPATETTVTKTWNQQFQLPASMSAVDYATSCSSMTITYTNHGNIVWTASDTRRVTNSYGAATVTPTYTNVINHAAIYLFNSTQSTTLTIPGFSFTASYAGTTTDLSRSLTPIKDFVGTSTIRDILGNTVSVTLTDRPVGTAVSTAGQGKYGYRFFMAKATGTSTSFKPCTITAGNPIIVAPKIGAIWDTYQNAFASSVPYLNTSNTYVNSKGVTLRKQIFDEATTLTPIAVFLLAPSSINIWNPAPVNQGRWADWNCLSCSSVAAPGSVNSDTLETYYLPGIATLIGDPKSSLEDEDGIYTKTWTNGLTSTMRFFFILTRNQTAPSDQTQTWTV